MNGLSCAVKRRYKFIQGHEHLEELLIYLFLDLSQDFFFKLNDLTAWTDNLTFRMHFFYSGS